MHNHIPYTDNHEIELTVAGTQSSCQPPWFETTIALILCFTASTASLAVKIPLITIGRELNHMSGPSLSFPM